MKTRIVNLSGLILTIGLTFSACSNSSSEKSSTASVIQVKTIQPTAEQTQAVIGNGRVQSKEIARLGTRSMGTVTSIRVKKGDLVGQGQLLLTISDEELQAKKAQTEAMIREAEAAFNVAQKDEERFAAMLAKQTVSTKEYENVHLNYLSMKSKLDAARQMRKEVVAHQAYTRITAPFSGMVSQINIDLGGLANPGMPLVVVEKGNEWVVESSVTESDISRIEKGMKAIVSIKSANLRFEAPITEKSLSSVETGGQYRVSISVPTEMRKKLYSGMYANVMIPLESMVQERPTGNLVIPTSTLIEKDGLTGVFVVSPTQTATLRWIRVGQRMNDRVEVTSGLQPTDQIILPEGKRLENGLKVELKN